MLRAHRDDPPAAYRAAIAEAATIIQSGGLVGFPTETVYGLAADALDPVAVARVYEAKARPLDSPPILHLADPGDAPRYAAGTPDEALALMEAFWPGPLTLVFVNRLERLATEVIER